MTFQWWGQTNPCPIVEFHDLRAENGAADPYLGLLGQNLAQALTAAGGAHLGQFRVIGQPDRLVVLRGFSGIAERREALCAFYAGDSWARHRRTATELVRSAETILARAVTPSEGIRPVRPDQSLRVLVSEVRFPEQVGNYHLWLRLLLRKAGLDPVATFATLAAVNEVPAVPVIRDRTHHIAILPNRGGLVPEFPHELRGMLRFSPELLELEPALSLVW